MSKCRTNARANNKAKAKCKNNVETNERCK